MKLRFEIFILLTLIVVLSLPIQKTTALSSASGYTDIESDEWWYYPIVAGSGELLECSFYSTNGVVEYFIVHNEYYTDNVSISEQLLLYHRTSSSENFQVVLPSDGGWYWVFINIGNNATRIHFQWEADTIQGLFTPYSLTLATAALGGIICLAGALHIRNKRKQA